MIKQVEAVMPTKWGNFNMLAYADDSGNLMPHIVMVARDFDPSQRVLVRIHSECLTGDLFGSKRCDCGEQLEKSLQLTNQEKGIIIYLRQEGRGIGIINKLKAYNLQDQGFDTIDANTHLGFEPDERDFSMVIQILKELGVQKINLLTNNPLKLEVFDNSGIDAKRVALEIPSHQENFGYLKTKKDKMGHLLNESLPD